MSVTKLHFVSWYYLRNGAHLSEFNQLGFDIGDAYDLGGCHLVPKCFNMNDDELCNMDYFDLDNYDSSKWLTIREYPQSEYTQCNLCTFRNIENGHFKTDCNNELLKTAIQCVNRGDRKTFIDALNSYVTHSKQERLCSDADLHTIMPLIILSARNEEDYPYDNTPFIHYCKSNVRLPAHTELSKCGQYIDAHFLKVMLGTKYCKNCMRHELLLDELDGVITEPTAQHCKDITKDEIIDILKVRYKDVYDKIIGSREIITSSI